MKSFHVVPVHMWVFSWYTGFFPQTHRIYVRLISNSKLNFGEFLKCWEKIKKIKCKLGVFLFKGLQHKNQTMQSMSDVDVIHGCHKQEVEVANFGTTIGHDTCCQET